MVTLLNASKKLLGKVAAIEPRSPDDQVTTGTGSTTTAKIAKLGAYEDDSFVDTHWLILPNGPSGSGSLEVQLVSDFDQDDGTGETVVTVNDPFSGTVADAVAAYVSPIHPEDVIRSLNTASKAIYPDVYVPRRYHHVSGSWAFNGHFDLWSGGLPVYWSRSSSNLSVSELNNPYYGTRGITLTADSGGPYEFYMTIPYNALLNELIGESVSFHAHMWSSAASSHGVIVRDGSGDSDEVQHDGDSTWAEVQTAAHTIRASSPTQEITFVVKVAASSTVHLDCVWTEGGPSQTQVLIPEVFRRAPTSVGIESVAWPNHRQDFEPEDHWKLRTQYPARDSAGNLSQAKIMYHTNGLTAKRLMVYAGDDYLSACSAQSDVYEVEEQHEDLFATLGIVNLKETLGEALGSGTEEWQQRMARNWMQVYRGLLKQPGQRMPRRAVAITPSFGGRPAAVGSFVGPDDR